MTDRTNNPTKFHHRLTAWVTDHDSPDGFIPAWAAIRLGALDIRVGSASSGSVLSC